MAVALLPLDTQFSPEGRDVLRVATLRTKAASLVRRRALGLLMRLPGGGGDLDSLVSRFPDEALLPLRRTGLDPVDELGRLRTDQPVSRLKLPLGLRGWLVTGYDEARAVLAADPHTFSNDFGNMVGKVGIAAEQDPGGLGFADPPAHSRLRHMLTPHFTTRALAQRVPRIREIIDDALDEMERAAGTDGVVDLQAHFAVPVPSRVMMELLGIPDADQDEFQRLSTQRFDLSGGASGSLDTISEAIDYLSVFVARQRIAPAPGLIATILAEYGDGIDDVELAGLADGVLTGGLETTVSMLTLGAQVLLQDAEAMAAVRDPARVDGFVEELLRYLSVVQVGFPRFARHDVTVGGAHILAGDVVLCSLSGANRDARHGVGMDRVDPHRAHTGHLAFGHGLHRCVGAELARIELRMAYPRLVNRFPRLRLAVAPDELSYRELSVVYGVDALPVALR